MQWVRLVKMTCSQRDGLNRLGIQHVFVFYRRVFLCSLSLGESQCHLHQRTSEGTTTTIRAIRQNPSKSYKHQIHIDHGYSEATSQGADHYDSALLSEFITFMRARLQYTLFRKKPVNNKPVLTVANKNHL